MVTSCLLRLVLYFAIFLSSSTVSQAISLMVVGVGDESGVGMIPRKIRWKDQHTSWMAVFQALPQRVRDLLLC